MNELYFFNDAKKFKQRSAYNNGRVTNDILVPAIIQTAVGSSVCLLLHLETESFASNPLFSELPVILSLCILFIL